MIIVATTARRHIRSRCRPCSDFENTVSEKMNRFHTRQKLHHKAGNEIQCHTLQKLYEFNYFIQPTSSYIASDTEKKWERAFAPMSHHTFK